LTNPLDKSGKASR